MRKLSLYTKLAINNIRRNSRIYIPYIMACVVCILTFYNLLFINQNEAISTLRGAVYVKKFTFLALFVIGFFCIILLLYTNSFLIKNRKKELGLYSILGLEKKNIGFILAIETLITSLVSIAIGILFSVLLSKLFLLVLLKLSKLDVTVPMPFSWNVCLYTIAFFLIIFGVILLYNIYQVKINSPIQLLSSSSQGEKAPKSSVLLFIIGILALAAGYWIALLDRNPVNSIFAFVLAAFLVIVATYCLFNAGSTFILGRLKGRKNFYYKPKNFIFISNMFYRMKQNAAGLATICILSCAVLVAVSTTSVLYLGAEEALNKSYPTDYQLMWRDVNIESQSDTLALLETVSKDTETKMKELSSYQLYRTAGTVENNRIVMPTDYSDHSVNLTVMIVDNYNEKNMANFDLSNDEILVYSQNPDLVHNQYVINDAKFNAQTISKTEGFTQATFSYGDHLYLVCTKDTAAFLGLVTVYNGISFNMDGSTEAKEAFTKEMYFKTTEKYYNLVDRDTEQSAWYALHGGFLFLGAFFGIIFLFATAIIIYYKQITEGYSDVERFSILKKVSMSDEEVRETINRQVKSVFFLPIITAIIHICFSTVITTRIITLMGIKNIPLTIMVTGVTIAVFVLIYLFVYRQTSKVYYNIVNRTSS